VRSASPVLGGTALGDRPRPTTPARSQSGGNCAHHRLLPGEPSFDTIRLRATGAAGGSGRDGLHAADAPVGPSAVELAALTTADPPHRGRRPPTMERCKMDGFFTTAQDDKAMATRRCCITRPATCLLLQPLRPVRAVSNYFSSISSDDVADRFYSCPGRRPGSGDRVKATASRLGGGRSSRLSTGRRHLEDCSIGTDSVVGETAKHRGRLLEALGARSAHHPTKDDFLRT